MKDLFYLIAIWWISITRWMCKCFLIGSMIYIFIDMENSAVLVLGLITGSAICLVLNLLGQFVSGIPDDDNW